MKLSSSSYNPAHEREIKWQEWVNRGGVARFWADAGIAYVKPMITVNTKDGAKLLASIKKAIKDKTVETWAEDTEGDFTHTPKSGQFKNEAYLRPTISEDGELILKIIFPKGKPKTKALYGIYHGRFAEMLLTHFGASFADLEITRPYDGLT